MPRIAALLLCLALVLALGIEPASAEIAAVPLLTAAKQQNARASTDRERRLIYSGNVKTKVFHNGQCRHFNCKSCSEVFDSPQEAIGKGYRACKTCGG